MFGYLDPLGLCTLHVGVEYFNDGIVPRIVFLRVILMTCANQSGHNQLTETATDG